MSAESFPSRLGSEMDPDSLIPVGTVGTAHGLRGEVRVRLFNPTSDAVRAGRAVVLRGPGEDRRMRVSSARASGRALLVAFEGVSDRSAAGALTGCQVAVRRGDLPPPGPGEFYHQDVIGLPVRTRGGRDVGRVASVMTGATDILVVEGSGGEVLVPVVEGFVAEVGPEVVVVEDDALE